MVSVPKATIPPFWRNVMAVVALGKAAIAGAGLGIATLGIVDVATAASIQHYVSEITHNHSVEAFSAVGGGVGFLWRLVHSVLG